MTLKPVFLFFLAFFLFPLSARAEDLQRFEYKGRERSYHIHAPENIPGPLPLVLVFHGALNNAFGIENLTGFSEKARDENFIVVYPNGTNEYDASTTELTWNGGNCCGYADAEQIDDAGFVRALIERIKKDYPVDPDRIYATGFSNGAILSYRLACEASDIFAAVAPVSGSQDVVCKPESPVSVLAIHGTADLKVLYDGGISPVIYGSKPGASVASARKFWSEYDGCSPEPEIEDESSIKSEIFSGCREGTAVEYYTIKGGEHEWPSGSMDAAGLIWDFFKKHPKSRA